MNELIELPQPPSTMIKRKYLEGFKGIFSSKSAMACLGGMSLAPAARQAIVLYSASFVRERFLVSIEFASIMIVGIHFCSVLGNLICERIVYQLGRRSVTILAGLIAGIFIISYTNTNHLWLVITFACLGSMFSGLMFTAGLSLSLEQVPGFYGSMMSLTSATAYVGMALGAGIGGLTLLWFGYEKVGLFLGVFSIVSALIFYFMVREPMGSKSNQQA